MPPKKGTPEYEAWRNSPAYEEYREKMSQAMRELWQSEEYREKQRQILQSEEYREKMSQALQELWQSEEYREKQRQIRRELWQSEEFREKQRRAAKSQWQDEEFREKVCRAIRDTCTADEWRERQRQIVQELWQTDEYVQKQMLARNLRPNGPEQLMEQLLNELLPGEYKYVGDGQLIIGGKCPDFANVNGKKKLIEVFGDYWHEGQDPQERIEFFRQYGFDCLVIWESELENLEEVAEKLRKFHSKI